MQSFSQNSFYYTRSQALDQHLSACIETNESIVGIVQVTDDVSNRSSYILELTKDGKFKKEINPFTSPCELLGIIQVNDNFLVYGYRDNGFTPFYWRGDAYAALISPNGQLIKEQTFQSTDSTISVFRESGFMVKQNEIFLFGAKLNHDQRPVYSFVYKFDNELNVLDSNTTTIVNNFYIDSYVHVNDFGFVFGNYGMYSIGYDLEYKYEASIPKIGGLVDIAFQNGNFYFGGNDFETQNDTNYDFHEYVRLNQSFNEVNYRRFEPYKSTDRMTRSLISGKEGQIILVGESYNGIQAPYTNSDIEVAVYNEQDNLVWAKNFQPGGYHFFYNALSLSDGGILITGALDRSNYTNRKDAFAMKIAPDGTLSVHQQKNPDFKVNIHPNPSKGLFQIDAGNVPFEIKVTDITGRIINLELLNNTIDLTNESDGTYFYTIIRNGATSSGMILKN